MTDWKFNACKKKTAAKIAKRKGLHSLMRDQLTTIFEANDVLSLHLVSNVSFFVLLPNFSCFYQVKIWNSARNKTNYTVTVATENLECRPPSLLVYGGQDISDYLTSGTTNNRIHFFGNRKLLNLESSVTNDNGQKECVFRHMCDEDMCHYVFISVQNVIDESAWKLCEVYFD